MSTLFFYDFETTGLPLWQLPSEDPGQPHIVQAAAILVDATSRETISSINLIADPECWNIPDVVAEVHGITTDFANQYGVPEDIIVNLMWRLWLMSDLRIGHNESFDARIMRIAMKRGLGGDPEVWKNGAAACTARLATPILDLLPTEKMLATGRRFPKTPTLAEAYEFFMGKPLEGAHNAMADVLACRDIWFAIKDREAA